MTRGLKIIMLVTGGLIAIAAIFYFIFLPFIKGSGEPEGKANANTPSAALTNANVSSKAVNNPPPPPAVAPEVEQASVAKSVARTFAERLGTYTSDNGLANLDDLKDISTPGVWKYLDVEYRQSLTKAMPVGYYRVTSTAMGADVVVVSASEVSATVPMQKVEAGAEPKTGYVTLELKLKKVGDQWLVSWMEWE